MREGQQTVALGRRLRDLLLAKGYDGGRDFRWVEDKDGVHHESAWGRRLRAGPPLLLPGRGRWSTRPPKGTAPRWGAARGSPGWGMRGRGGRWFPPRSAALSR